VFDINLHYNLGKDDAFIEKWLDIKSKNGRPYLLKEVVMEDVAVSSQIKEIHLHDDNTIWCCPINLFLRSDKGGVYSGLEYPWWKLNIRGDAGSRLGYAPQYQAAASEVNTSEKYFLGIYRKEGISRYSHGPYPGKVPADFMSGEHTGLSQHFKDGRIPEQAVEPEILDWGEVWAMQEFMRHVLPELPLPEDGYWIWQNGLVGRVVQTRHRATRPAGSYGCSRCHDRQHVVWARQPSDARAILVQYEDRTDGLSGGHGFAE